MSSQSSSSPRNWDRSPDLSFPCGYKSSPLESMNASRFYHQTHNRSLPESPFAEKQFRLIETTDGAANRGGSTARLPHNRHRSSPGRSLAPIEPFVTGPRSSALE